MRHFFTLLLLAACLQAAPWSPATVDNFTPSLMRGLVAYWKLDEASGTRYDSWTNGYHLTDVNTVPASNGIIANCPYFSTGDYLKNDATTNFISGANWTINFWIKIQEFATKDVLSFAGDSIISGELDFYITGQNLFYYTTAQNRRISESIVTNQWYMFTLVCSNSLVYAYQDAILTTNGFAAPTKYDFITVGGIRNTAQFSGFLDEISIYRVAVTNRSDRLLLYNLGKARRFPFNSGP